MPVKLSSECSYRVTKRRKFRSQGEEALDLPPAARAAAVLSQVLSAAPMGSNHFDASLG
jgi:hypothetical protein